MFESVKYFGRSVNNIPIVSDYKITKENKYVVNPITFRPMLNIDGINKHAGKVFVTPQINIKPTNDNEKEFVDETNLPLSGTEPPYIGCVTFLLNKEEMLREIYNVKDMSDIDQYVANNPGLTYKTKKLLFHNGFDSFGDKLVIIEKEFENFIGKNNTKKVMEYVKNNRNKWDYNVDNLNKIL